MIFVEQKISL